MANPAASAAFSSFSSCSRSASQEAWSSLLVQRHSEPGNFFAPFTYSARSRELATGVRVADYTRWGKPGIRAQLVDIRTKRLEMDFVIEGDNRSLHVLNAVSPAFTCSLPFADYVCDRIEHATQ